MTNPDNVGGLLPCPFCGASAAELSDTVAIGVTDAQFMHTIVCNVNHGGCGATSGYDWEADKAIAAWNRRAELCRAAPAGGECQHEWQPDADVMNARYCPKCDVTQTIPRKPKDSAPAGSGEFDAWFATAYPEVNARANEGDLASVGNRFSAREGWNAALLRKLQQGAEAPKES